MSSGACSRIISANSSMGFTWGFPSVVSTAAFPEHKEIRVIFSCVNLPHHPANTRAVVADDDEQIFRNKPDLLIHLDDFNVSESLAIGANFVLAFYNENAPIL